jgi:hypothetical protein
VEGGDSRGGPCPAPARRSETTPPGTPLPVPQHATSWDAMRRISVENNLEVLVVLGAQKSSQAEGRRFESGIPLDTYDGLGRISRPRSHLWSHLRGSKTARDGFGWGRRWGAVRTRFSSENRRSASLQFTSEVGPNVVPPPVPPARSSRRGSGGTRRSTPAIAARFSSRPTVE